MSSYNELIALINGCINRNGVQAITGRVLNGVLRAMVNQLGAGYAMGGVAHPTDDPGTPDAPVCYYASEVGTYTHFGNIQIVPGELALLCFDLTDGWFKETMYEGFESVQATIDGNVGTPAVNVTYVNGVLSFDFSNMKGNTGAAAGFGNVTAAVDGTSGTPGVSVQTDGPDTAKNIAFQFTGLKGETGVTSVIATVDNTSGTPQCAVSLNGQQLTLAFTGLKGAQGDTGVSADYPITIVNNLTTNDPTSALSAAQGVVLDGKVSQLEAKMLNYEIESEINLLSFTEKSGFMANDTQWLIPIAQNPRTHISIPVAVGDWYQLEAQEQQGARIAFLTYDQIPTTNLETIDSVGAISIWQNATSNFQIPEGCTYLAINKTRVDANDWLPKKLYKTKPPVGLTATIDELKGSVYHLDYPPFFSQNADWDIIKTDEVRGTLVDLELIRGELPNGSYIKYMGGRSQNPGQFAFFVYDSSGDTLSSIVKVIPTNGTLSTIYSNGACSFRLVVDGSKMKMGETTFFDWSSSDLLLDNNYLRVEGTPKTIVCFGDSITQFSDSSGLSYPQYLSRLSGCKVYNAGIGGTRLARRATPTAPVTTEEMAWASVDISNLISAWINNDWTVVDSAITYLYNHGHDYRDIVAGLKLIDASTVDIVTIFGGTNDFTGDSSLGVIGSTDISNVSGALETIINLIQTENPAIEIFVFTPIVRYINNTRTDAYWSDNYESNGKKLPDVAEHIEKTCKYFHINCENWYWTLGWNQFNFSEYFNDNDGTHPYKGFKYIGEKMFRYIYGKTNFSK